MKKLLTSVALAAATVASFAQNVTISGQMDAGMSSLRAQDGTASKDEILGNGASTSFIAFEATEDLGGGLKAGMKGVNLISATSGLTSNGSTAYSTSNFFNDEIWVGLSGSFGGIKLGSPHAGMYETNGKATPYGTALGGGYSSSGINRLLGSTTTLGVNQFVGGVAANGRVIRSEKSVRYDTPVISGFSGSLTKAFQNDQSSTATSNSNDFTDATINYTNGPLNVAYSAVRVAAGDVAAQGNNAASALIAGSSVDYRYLAANYKIANNLTVYYGQTTGQTAGLSNNRDIGSQSVAVKYGVTPAVDLMASIVAVKDNSASSAKDQSLKSVSAHYNFSKRTSAYATVQDYDTDMSSDTAGQVTQYIVGLRHKF